MPIKIFSCACKTGVGCLAYLLQLRLSGDRHDNIMHAHCDVALAAAAIVIEVFCNGAALASQGPGGGMGTASHLTQVAMAILVYGASALVVGAGLIGAVRGREVT
ncbi:MAG: hypothetical protein ABJA75_18110 [Bradyrhizobium sp.]